MSKNGSGFIPGGSFHTRWIHFDTDPEIRIRILSLVLQMLENPIYFTLINSSANLHCFIFLIRVIGVIIFNILDSKVPYIEIFRREYSLTLNLVKIDMDADLAN
jgi:hypothetical protein